MKEKLTLNEQKAICKLIKNAIAAGMKADEASRVFGITRRTYLRWSKIHGLR